MQGIKRKRQESDFVRNVKPKATPAIISIIAIKDVFGEIMGKLIRPAGEHDTQYEVCTEEHCYCHFAFAFTSLSLASKSTYDACNNYKNAYEERISESKSIPIGAFRMSLDVWCVYAATYGYLEVMKYARVVLKAPWFGPGHMHEDWTRKFKVFMRCPCEVLVRALFVPDDTSDWVVTSNASKHGHRDCLEYAHSNGATANDNGFIHAAQNGHTDCVRFYLDNIHILVLNSSFKEPGLTSIFSHALKESTMAKNIECTELLISLTPDPPNCAIHKCAQTGNIAAAKKIIKKYGGQLIDVEVFIAVVSGDSEDNLSFLEWMFKKLSRAGSLDAYEMDRVVNVAAFNGNLKCLQLLASRGVNLGKDAMQNAAIGGQLKCIKYLHSIGCKWDETIMAYASEAGSLECMRYARENGCPVNKYVNHKTRDVECLKYAHEHGSMWYEGFLRETMCHHDCGDNVLPLMEYAIDNGCPVDIVCFKVAAHYASFNIIKYLHERGCPWDAGVLQLAHKSVYDDSLKCVHYLLINGCPMPEE